MEEEVRTAAPAFDPAATVAYLAVETAPRSVSAVVKYLARAHPLPRPCFHLKRVRRKPFADEANKEANKDARKETEKDAENAKNAKNAEVRMQILVGRQGLAAGADAFPDDVRAHIVGSTIVHIPVQCPATLEEHAVAKRFWPMSFHDTTKNNNKSDAARSSKGGGKDTTCSNDGDRANSFAAHGQDPISSEPLRLRCRGYMRLAVEAARRAGERVGCIFVDPKSGNVVARSSDPDTTVPPSLSNSSGSGSSSTATSTQDAAATLRKRLRTPVMRCISSVAAAQALTSTRAKAVGAALGLPLPDGSARQHDPAPASEAYLCTGLDAFVTLEPSPMCAMALLHSRVGRVFYGASDTEAGVLGSNGMLHEEKTINHRYRVFRCVLEAECQALCSEGPACAGLAAAAGGGGVGNTNTTDPRTKRARLC